jgi:hypothetical protein
MSDYIKLEDKEGVLQNENISDKLLKEGGSSDATVSGFIILPIGEIIRMMNGEYSLTTPSGKEIKRFKKKPTESEISDAKRERYLKLGYA